MREIKKIVRARADLPATEEGDELLPVSEAEALQRLERLVEHVNDLPAIPRVALHVARLVEENNSSAFQVAHALSADQVLTAKVLKMANSAFYGSPRRISTVTDAIVLLGMRTIRNIALAVSCYDVLDREVTSYAIRRGDLWKHSLCCGYAAQQLAKRAGYKLTEEAFVAGLLHDIGKVLLSLRLGQGFAKIQALAIREGIPFTDAERRVLGFDHAEVGARLTEQWNLPEQLVMAIRFHHNPALQPTANPLTSIVHVADILCITLGIGLGSDGLRYCMQEGMIDDLGLSEEAIEDVLIMLTEFAAQPTPV